MSRRIKQVILIRKDLKMRRGKEIAQGSHASNEFLINQIRPTISTGIAQINFSLTPEESQWIKNGMAKICLKVNSEEELLSINDNAIKKGIKSFLIKDSGKTEFNGVATYTACAIGPYYVDEIDEVTSHLALY